jgi:hypothetical protein
MFLHFFHLVAYRSWLIFLPFSNFQKLILIILLVHILMLLGLLYFIFLFFIDSFLWFFESFDLLVCLFVLCYLLIIYGASILKIYFFGLASQGGILFKFWCVRIKFGWIIIEINEMSIACHWLLHRLEPRLIWLVVVFIIFICWFYFLLHFFDDVKFK